MGYVSSGDRPFADIGRKRRRRGGSRVNVGWSGWGSGVVHLGGLSIGIASSRRGWMSMPAWSGIRRWVATGIGSSSSWSRAAPMRFGHMTGHMVRP